MAVVRNSTLDIRSLQGHRSCHSGVRWTAGWSLPLGFLLSRNYLSWSKEQPLSQGKEIIISCQQNSAVWKLLLSILPFLVLWFFDPLTCFSPLEQTSVPFSMPAVFLELLPWHQVCALCAKARSPTFARRIITVKRPTVSPSTTAKGPSGQAQQMINKLPTYDAHLLYLWHVDIEMSFFYCLLCSVTDVSGSEQEMLHLWTI